MRHKLFIAEHRGGLLKKEQHRQLMIWAYQCAEHVLPLLKFDVDERLEHALQVAKDWVKGKATTGDAMKASRAAHAVARNYADPVSTAVARAIGQAVATAHMADHCMGGALYALKALQLAGKPIEKERAWQNKQLERLPNDIVELVLATMAVKGTILLR